MLLVFNFTAPQPYLAVATVLLWGAVAFGNVPGLQVTWCARLSAKRRRRSMWPRA